LTGLTGLTRFNINEGLGSFRRHARVDGHPVSPMPISLDSRLRGNDGGLQEKLPDPTYKLIFSKAAT